MIVIPPFLSQYNLRGYRAVLVQTLTAHQHGQQTLGHHSHFNLPVCTFYMHPLQKSTIIFFLCLGVSVSVFGPIQSGSGSQTAYSIDGGDAQLVTAVPPVGVEFIFQQLLFNRSGLAGDVQHTLSVTTVMVTNAIYYVDYIEVQAAPSVTKTLASGNSITTSTTKWTDIPWINTSAIQVSSTSEAFNLNTASPKLVDSTHPTSITPILVAALGGIIFLLLIAASVLFLRWRRHRSMYLESIAVRSVTGKEHFFRLKFYFKR